MRFEVTVQAVIEVNNEDSACNIAEDVLARIPQFVEVVYSEAELQSPSEGSEEER